MANQTHLLRQLDRARPDDSAAPRTDNLICGSLDMLRTSVVLRMKILTQLALPD